MMITKQFPFPMTNVIFYCPYNGSQLKLRELRKKKVIQVCNSMRVNKTEQFSFLENYFLSLTSFTDTTVPEDVLDV